MLCRKFCSEELLNLTLLAVKNLEKHALRKKQILGEILG
jgi:hypothetical protein